MIKALTKEMGVFTHAEIKALHENGCADCELIQILEVTDTESGEVKQTEQYREKNISFNQECWPFELTDEEKAILLPSEPVLTLDDYKAEKLAKLADFDKSEAVNSFTIQGLPMWLDNDTRRKLKFRMEAEKAIGKTETTLWFNGIPFTFPIDTGLGMVNNLEVYASECYDRTQEHERNIKALESKEDVLSYEFSGYPNKLEL